jgi:hypothetical protein
MRLGCASDVTVTDDNAAYKEGITQFKTLRRTRPFIVGGRLGRDAVVLVLELQRG